MTKSPLALALITALAMCTAAQATLIDRSGGMVYDTALDLTWLSDANYGVTSGLLSSGGSNWGQATQWAADLNYGGYTGWRLPTTLVPDTGCSGYFGFADSGTGCKGSELGELFYTEGGLAAGQSILSSAILSSHFVNMKAVYWSGTEYAPNPATAWEFITIGDPGLTVSGTQTHANKINGFFGAWAVHAGDIGAAPTNSSSVPEPSSVMLVSLAMVGLAAVRRRVRSETRVSLPA